MSKNSFDNILYFHRKFRLFESDVFHPAAARILHDTALRTEYSHRDFVLVLVLDRRQRDARAGVSGIVDGPHHDNAKCEIPNAACFIHQGV